MMGYTQEQEQVLESRGLSQAQATALGVLSIASPAELPTGLPQWWAKLTYPLLLIPADVNGFEQWQARPAKPYVKKDGTESKYVVADGNQQGLIARRTDRDGPVLIVEGTFQSLAVATYAPSTYNVMGMAGCYGWRKDGMAVDLGAATGRDAIICLDADVKTNLDVWQAGEGLKAALLNQGVKSVKFLTLDDTNGKVGIDDVLGRLPVDRRSTYVAGALAHGLKESVKRPSARVVAGMQAAKSGDLVTKYFNGAIGKANFKSQTFSKDFRAKIPCALTPEKEVAVYRNGVFSVETDSVVRELADWFGDDFVSVPQQLAAQHIAADLWDTRLPQWGNEPLLNCLNGMVDLRTGELLPHDPKFLSTTQIPINYSQTASAPRYEAWMAAQAGSQTGALEYYASLMLDPSKTASKAIFLYGPSRTGKSTFLRLMEAVAGPAGINRSALSLQELSESAFAPAELYGKILNSCAELPSGHVDQIATFKKVLGGDALTGNRKYGKMFTFTNRASLVFSANSIPTVSEKTKAYLERMAPFEFNNSFIECQDESIERAMLAELPGILTRWVKAWQRAYVTGVIPQPAEQAVAKFAENSDQVSLFAGQCLSASEDKSNFMTVTRMHDAYKDWRGNDKWSIGKIAFSARVRSILGEQIRTSDGKRGYYLSVIPDDERVESSDDYDYSLPIEVADSGALNRVSEALEQQPESASAPVESVTDALVIVPDPVPDTKVLDTEVPNIKVRIGPPVPAVVVDWSVLWRQDLKKLFSDHHREIPRCPKGHKMSWVDGAWWACPVCHPKSVERP